MKFLVIYDSSKKVKLPLGDVVRFLDVIKSSNYLIATNKENNDFFKHFNQKSTLAIDEIELKDKNYKVVNLTLGKKHHGACFDINDHLNFQSLSKVSTFKLIEIFQKKIEHKTRVYKSNFETNKNITIGFNWIVPESWKIKSYPKGEWISLKKNILEKYKVKISWQKKENLDHYVGWIKSCDLLISIVGLGVHIANYFDKKVIMLSGPTDFSESSSQKNIKKILPESFCEYRPCNLINGVNNCGCMGDIKVSKIFTEVQKILL